MKNVLLILTTLVNLSWTVASELQPVAPKRTVREIVAEQCSDVGGTFTGVCHCGAQRDVIEMTLAAAEVVHKKKINTKTFAIINPFEKSCNSEVNLEKFPWSDIVVSRITEALLVIHNDVYKNTQLTAEVEVMLEVGLLDIDNVLNYVSSAKAKESVKKRITKLKDKFEKMSTMIATGPSSIRQEAIGRAKKMAMDEINKIVGFDIKVAAQVIKSLESNLPAKAALAQFSRDEAVAVVKSVKSQAKTIAFNFGGQAVRGLKSGVGGIARVVAVQLVAGYFDVDLDWTEQLTDPFYIATAMANTRSMDLAANPMRAFNVENFIIKDTTPDYMRHTVEFMRSVGEPQSYSKFTSNVMMIGLYTDVRQQVGQITSIATLMDE